MAMVMMAASAFHAGHSDVAEIETAYHTLTPLLGAGAAGVFLIVAAGLRPVELGGRHDGGPDDHAGLRRLPHSDLVRRLVTMMPAFVVVALGVNATQALVDQPGGAVASRCRCR